MPIKHGSLIEGPGLDPNRLSSRDRTMAGLEPTTTNNSAQQSVLPNPLEYMNNPNVAGAGDDETTDDATGVNNGTDGNGRTYLPLHEGLGSTTDANYQ